MVPSVFSSLFPKARVSVIAGSVGFRAYFMPQPWQSQLPFFVGIPSAETIAVCAPQQGDSPSPLWGRQLSSGALPAFDLLGMAASLGMGNHGGFLTQIPTCCRGERRSLSMLSPVWHGTAILARQLEYISSGQRLPGMEKVGLVYLMSSEEHRKQNGEVWREGCPTGAVRRRGIFPLPS